MVRPERFELPTYCSGGNRSIHLSYGRTPMYSVYIERICSSNSAGMGFGANPMRNTSFWEPTSVRGLRHHHHRRRVHPGRRLHRRHSRRDHGRLRQCAQFSDEPR